MPFDKELVYLGSVDFDYGIAAATQISQYAKSCPANDKPTACFATADVLSIGMIKGLGNCGFRVPNDFSIVGFDDVYLARL